MQRCLADDDLLELRERGRLGEAPALESHLADCPECSALAATFLSAEADGAEWGRLVGTRLGRYRLEGQIGGGGMGSVYEGFDLDLERKVAVKVLRDGDDSADHERRLQLEGRAGAAVRHPNVVPVYDVGRDNGLTYVVSELVAGESLRSTIERGDTGVARSIALGIDLCRGLTALHEAGVCHRDLKPENLIIDDNGGLRILDFGLARFGGRDAALDLTLPGTVLGTAGYMSPEQGRAEDSDPRSDIFSAGAILFELATGERAFPGASHAERIAATLRDDACELATAQLGPLTPVIRRCLAKRPSERFQSAPDLRWALEAAGREPIESSPTRRGLSRRAILAAAAALGGAGAALGIERFARGALGLATVPPPPEPKRVRVRQLTYRHGRLFSARFTADGKGIVYGAAWDGGPLSVHRATLAGGIASVLDVPPADPLAVASDGALAIALDRRNVHHQSATGELAIVPADGGAMRRQTHGIEAADFAADGELAVVRRTRRGFVVEWPLGNPIFEGGWLTDLRVSPAGDQLAVIVHPDTRDDRGDIVLLDRAGNKTALSSGWASARGLAFGADGKRVLFTAARDSANCALYSISARGTREELVFETPGRLRLHDMHPDATALVSRDTWRLKTLVGSRSGGAERDRSLSEVSLAVSISDGGDTVTLAELGGVAASNGAYLRPTGEPALRLGPDFPIATDGRGERVATVSPARPGAIVLRSSLSSRTTTLELDALAHVSWAVWPDPDTLIAGGTGRDGHPRLWRVSISSGTAEPLGDRAVFGATARLDSTRDRLAMVDTNGRLLVVSASDGASTAIGEGLFDQFVCGWDGDGVLIATSRSPVEISRVDVASKQRRPFFVIRPPAVGLRGVDAVVFANASDDYAYSVGQELSQLYALSL